MNSDSLTTQCPERAILNHFQRPAAILCESLKPLQQEIAATKEKTAQLKTKHRIADLAAACGNKELLLNVGGSEWCVKRQHMTQGEGVENTLLAVLFSGKFDNRLIRDDKQRVFLDVDSEAFKTVHKAILEARAVQQAARKGGRGRNAVSCLLTEADTRGHKGLHDFWVKKLLAPHDIEGDRTKCREREPSVTAEGIGEEAGELVSALNDVLKAYSDKRSSLEAELRTEKMRDEHLNTELELVSSFLAPLDGDDPVLSVDVCGQTISTCQSTIDAMTDEMALKRRNTQSLWGSSVHDVPPDHMSRLIDHHRRKRHGASPAEANVPLQMDNAREQAAFDVNAAMYGVVKTGTPHGAQPTSNGGFTVTSGVRYRIVTPGKGNVPGANQTVKYDEIWWSDGFDGNDKAYDERGKVLRVSDWNGWWREAVLSMRIGEVRQIILPGASARYVQLRLVSIV
ncbi:unnamed protein product [Vitrella brassicaformis CCMP3155]|uniref:Uncharacterized protein n=1 Tax=Vitrella brassicaformis (strain CCMP3155) TaxID=1169540 RepID=A0A0G4H4N8_VITBC|nr:unnamed protein product [Vitrella brassicaformis CCMP3155]|eukprot:CEM38759.1 unnamed protein product [Vitrella brassicaformis CCMP3155]